MEQDLKPFTMSHVLRATAKHMRRCIDISIRKTYARMAEFDNDSEKCTEVVKTLGVLHKMRNMLDIFQKENQEDFKD